MRRRQLIAALAALPFAGSAMAQPLEMGSLGLDPASTGDQSAALQDAMLRAASEKRPLELPAGTFFVQNLQVPSNLVLRGVPGATTLAAAGAAPIARIAGSAHVRFEDLGFNFGNGGPEGEGAGLIEIEASEHVLVGNCTLTGGMASAIAVHDATVRIEGCDITGPARAAIYALEARGLQVSGNRIARCGNGGILIRGGPNRRGNAIITGNRIVGIGARAGGNGHNGNAIGVTGCDDVVVADNQIVDCAFSAVRLGASSNVSVTGNLCRNCGEVAIVSEAGFAGTAIADNVIDGAGAGIVITGMDQSGHVATCSGNVVRNIRATSPDSTLEPVGIHVEAETSVVGNMIHNVDGIGIRAGRGSFLRHVVIASNTLDAIRTGIAVSVVEDPEPGPVLISGNLIGTPLEHAIIGLGLDQTVSDDLIRDAARYPHVSLSGNLVTR